MTSVGNVAVVRPGEVNLMTAGRGISHSENTLAGGNPSRVMPVEVIASGLVVAPRRTDRVGSA